MSTQSLQVVAAMMKSPFVRPSKAMWCKTQKLCRTMHVLQVL